MRRRAESVQSETDVPVSRRARLVLWPLLALVLVHTLIIAMWVGPSTPVRTMIGTDTLRSYVMPVFEQNWRIFAPTPRRIAVELEVRALIRDDETGEEQLSEWVNLVNGEDSLIRHNPFPPRLALAARRTANHLDSRMGDLSEGQRVQVEANYFTTPVAELRDRMLAVEDDDAGGANAVDGYLRYDAVASALATYYLAGTWSDEVTHVQYRTSVRYTPSFEQRHERDLDDADRRYREYGWRPASEVSEQAVELFMSYADAIEGGLQ